MLQPLTVNFTNRAKILSSTMRLDAGGTVQERATIGNDDDIDARITVRPFSFKARPFCAEIMQISTEIRSRGREKSRGKGQMELLQQR